MSEARLDQRYEHIFAHFIRAAGELKANLMIQSAPDQLLRDGQSPSACVGAAGQEVVILEQDHSRAPTGHEMLNFVHYENRIPPPAPTGVIAVVEGDDRTKGALVGTATRPQNRGCRNRA